MILNARHEQSRFTTVQKATIDGVLVNILDILSEDDYTRQENSFTSFFSGYICLVTVKIYPNIQTAVETLSLVLFC
jgi:hypothetical protein